MGEVHQRLTVKAAFFYANNGVVASADPGWLQLAFDHLTGIFDQVGLWANVLKTMGVVYRPCQSSGVRADDAYTRWMIGEWWGFKERQRKRVLCPECGGEMAKGSLVTHFQTQHGVVKGGWGPEGDESDRGDDPRTYKMVFPMKSGTRPFPV